MPYLSSPRSSITENSSSIMTENNKNCRNKSKKNNNNSSSTSKKTKTKGLIEQNNSNNNNNVGSPNIASLEIGDPIEDLLNQSSVLKWNRRLEGHQDDAGKKSNDDDDFRSQYNKSTEANNTCYKSDQIFSQKKGDSYVSDFTSPTSTFTHQKGTAGSQDSRQKEHKNCESATHCQEKQKRIKNASPRRSGKKHIRKLDFSLPMDILNRHAFLLWFSGHYQEYSRQYPNETVTELQDRWRSSWDQLDYRKKAPYLQRARDASCIPFTPSVDSGTPTIPENPNPAVAEVKVESRPRGKPKSDTLAQLTLRENIRRHFSFKYEFEQIVNDLIWGRPVHFENNVKSEKLSQILSDLADLETSGKLAHAL